MAIWLIAVVGGGRRLPFGPKSAVVLFVAAVFHPVGGLAVELLLNGDMAHRRGWRRAMPMLLSGRNPDDVTRPDFLDRPAPTLSPATAGRHDQGLTERVCMPRGPCARLECDAGAESACGSGRIEQRVDPHRTGKILRRSFGGRLRTTFLDVHFQASFFQYSNVGPV